MSCRLIVGSLILGSSNLGTQWLLQAVVLEYSLDLAKLVNYLEEHQLKPHNEAKIIKQSVGPPTRARPYLYFGPRLFVFWLRCKHVHGLELCEFF